MSRETLRRLLEGERVAITGCGVLCAAGRTPEDLFDAACAGRSAAGWREYEAPWGALRIPACAVPDEWLDLEPATRRMADLDRGVRLSWVSAARAWRDAGLEGVSLPPERVGVVVGTSRGAVGELFEVGDALRGSGRIRAGHAVSTGVASYSGALAQALALEGPSLTVSATCASGAVAVAMGAELIATGAADAVLVGGADASLHPGTALPLARAGLLADAPDPRLACRPFDRRRRGMLLGEGAAFLVLEREGIARGRGATVRGFLAGWGTGSEPSGRTGVNPDGVGLSRVAREALALAGARGCDVGYINAHGTGTVLNDRAEARALSRLEPGDGRRIPCGSTKPIAGHCLGAAAVIEAVICLEALARGVIPPSANCEELDPQCPIDVVIGGPRSADLRLALSTSLGFWGKLGALVFAAP